MIWNSFADFINMNGYGPYVWGSFSVTLVLFLIEYRSLRQAEKTLALYEDHS